MIELKFSTSDDMSIKDLQNIIHWRDYMHAIWEIKSVMRDIYNDGRHHVTKFDMDDKMYALVEYINSAISEITRELPEDY